MPDADDVVDAIIADHVEFERLLRVLRQRTGDLPALRRQRESARTALAGLLVGHAEAEESVVYPHLRELGPDRDHGDHVDHGEDEHVEGHEALLALLDLDDVTAPAFDLAVTALATVLYHHLDEEERTLLNDARRHLSAERRRDLGRRWTAERDRLIATGCGRREAVSALLAAARPAS